MNDKHFDWLSDMLNNELLISEKELAADLHKSEHSFLRNLLNDAAMNDKHDDVGRSDKDVFNDTVTSAMFANTAVDPLDSAGINEQSDTQVLSSESETVVKPSVSVDSVHKRSRLHFQITRANSAGDDSADSLLKTPAGFYDRCASGCLSIPPLFDYSSSLFSDSSSSFSSTDNSALSSILEDEKWSEGSEISSVDIDASSVSALSPVDFSEDGILSVSEDEDRLSKQEERVVLSVVQNVLSDETISLGLDDADKDGSCIDKCEHSPEIPLLEKSVVKDRGRVHPLSATDALKLNPLAQPFTYLPKMSLQPVPVVYTHSMPTVVVPVKFAYTSLVPVDIKKTSSTRLQKSVVNQSSTLMLPSKTSNSMYFKYDNNNVIIISASRVRLLHSNNVLKFMSRNLYQVIYAIKETEKWHTASFKKDVVSFMVPSY